MMRLNSRILVAVAATLLIGASTSERCAVAAEIHEAVLANDLPKVRKLIAENRDVAELADADFNTPLHLAVAHADIKMVSVLLAHIPPYKVDETNSRAQTPLHLCRDAEIARLLIGKGADLKVSKGAGTPLDAALAARNLEVIKVLLEAGEQLDFEKLVELGIANEVAKVLRVKPWLAKKPNSGLRVAVEKGHLAVAKVLLQYGSDPNLDYESQSFEYFSNRTPFSAAVTYGHFDIAELLCRYGARTDVGGSYGDNGYPSVVHQAAASLDLRYLRLILEHGADVNSRKHSPGVTPLHLAASIGDREKCALLIKHRADLNLPSDHGATPLMFAAFWGYRPVCDLLLANGAELDFYSACALGRLNDVKKMLADRPELATLRERHLLRPPLLWAAAGGNVEIVELLLKQGADVNARAHRVNQGHDYFAGPNVWGDESDDADARETALHAAATAGHDAVIKLLLDKGAELKAEDDDKETALQRAADKGHAAAAKVLLDANPEAEIEVERDSFIAYAIKSPQIMKLVLALKPTPQTLQYALVESSEVNPEVAELILAHGAEAGLRTACILGKTKRVAELLAAEPPVPDVKPQYDLVGKWQFVTLAAQYGRVDTVAWFVDHGLDLTVWGEESLVAAIEGGHAKVVKLLLEKGVKIPARTLKLKPMLNLSASTGSVEVARLLIANGCDVDSRDDRRVTPLHVAALEGHTDLVAFLLKSGADANATDDAGQTPLAAVDSDTNWNTGDRIKYNPAVIKLLRIHGGVR